MRSHPYVRAYLAGIALPTLVVCAAGSITVVFFDRLEPAVQRAMFLPIAAIPVLWGLWNVVWVALGPPRRVQIGWHGAILAALVIGVGVLLAGRLNVSDVTPQRGRSSGPDRSCVLRSLAVRRLVSECSRRRRRLA
jgi:hypothetical protein